MTKIAICQTNTGLHPQNNANLLVTMIEAAARNGAQMVFTPEMSGLIDRNAARAAASICDENTDIMLTAMRGVAARCHIWIVLGSLAITGEQADGRLVNRSFVIDDRGIIRARYDKLHLFDVDLTAGETWRESARYAPGDRAVVVVTPAGQLGLSVCYDLRFPTLYNALSQAGAEILNIPAAFTVPTGQAHWHVLMRARAIENGAYVIAAAQSGTHEDGRVTFGHSLVVDPWGQVLIDMGQAVGVDYADIDLAHVAKARLQIPVIKHRRIIPEVSHC